MQLVSPSFELFKKIVYSMEATVTGKDGAQVKYVFAPFSHDAEVPEPSALLLGSGLVALAFRRR